jgi:hypothetical protein
MAGTGPAGGLLIGTGEAVDAAVRRSWEGCWGRRGGYCCGRGGRGGRSGDRNRLRALARGGAAGRAGPGGTADHTGGARAACRRRRNRRSGRGSRRARSRRHVRSGCLAAHALVVDERPVEAAQIAQHEVVAAQLDDAVLLRDDLVEELDRVVRVAPERVDGRRSIACCPSAVWRIKRAIGPEGDYPGRSRPAGGQESAGNGLFASLATGIPFPPRAARPRKRYGCKAP